MNVPAWVKYNSDTEKLLCKKLLALGLYDDNINLSRLASDLGFTASNFCNFPDDKIIEVLKNEKYLVSGSDLSEKSNISTDNTPKKSQNIKDTNKTEKKRRGRPIGSTKKSKGENTSHEIRNELLKVKNGDFPEDITEKYSGIVENTNYIELFSETVQSIKEKFFAEYPDRIKKHPSTWFRFLCLKVKQNSPRVDFSRPDLVSGVWDIYSNLCLEVGINRTIENFQIFSGLNWGYIEKIKEGSSPEYISLSKKIYLSCKGDIVGGLSSSFGSSPNQMFIAKSIYGIVENTVVTHVSASDHGRNIDDIPLFIEEK